MVDVIIWFGSLNPLPKSSHLYNGIGYKFRISHLNQVYAHLPGSEAGSSPRRKGPLSAGTV